MVQLIPLTAHNYFPIWRRVHNLSNMGTRQPRPTCDDTCDETITTTTHPPFQNTAPLWLKNISCRSFGDDGEGRARGEMGLGRCRRGGRDGDSLNTHLNAKSEPIPYGSVYGVAYRVRAGGRSHMKSRVETCVAPLQLIIVSLFMARRAVIGHLSYGGTATTRHPSTFSHRPMGLFSHGRTTHMTGMSIERRYKKVVATGGQLNPSLSAEKRMTV